ncbi:MAG: hypothetical protein ABR936_03160 [Bacteroidota bacterium]|jgi:hypothetical protein
MIQGEGVKSGWSADTWFLTPKYILKSILSFDGVRCACSRFIEKIQDKGTVAQIAINREGKSLVI